jgi:mycothiol synthase
VTTKLETTTTIRSARPSERRSLETLQRRSSLDGPMYREQLAAHPDAIELPAEQIAAGLVRVAEQDGVIVGFSVLLERSGDACALDGLFVEPERMRGGVGRLLVEDAKAIAWAHGAARIDVVANPQAVAFYDAVGFVPAGEAQTRFGPAARMSLATLTWRSLTIADAPALARARAAVETVDRTGEHYLEQDIRDQLQDESIDLGRDTLGALAPAGELIAFALLEGQITDIDRVYVDGAVRPEARGHGLGRRLLEWAAQRAAILHEERHPEVPGAVCVVVHEHNASKQALLRAAGYEAARWEHTMTRSLSTPLPDVPQPPPGLALEPYEAVRDEAVRLAHHEAFADHWAAFPPDEQHWARWYTGARAFRPGLSWLVLEGDDVVAYLLSYFWEADAAASGVREAYVGQVGVRPAWRRRGLGRLLLAAALRSYRSAGYERAALMVDTGNATGALGLYERAGFTVRDTTATWTKPLA